MHATLKTILEGVYDPDCILNVLLGKPHIVRNIWIFIKNSWKRHIKLPTKNDIDHYNDYRDDFSYDKASGATLVNDLAFFRLAGYCQFPEPTNININMMPFIVSTVFEKTKLPASVLPYKDMIRQVIQTAYGWNNRNKAALIGKIFFLTIQESWVEENTSQRRAGLHTDNPGPIKIRKSSGLSNSEDEMKTGGFSKGSGSHNFVECWHHWGNTNDLGGIYMASNVADSCQVWNCKVIPDEETGLEVISHFGDIEHLREFLPAEESVQILDESCIYWITDRTPHESLPLKKGQYRQFFRIVTSDVSLWFVDDNTENPNGVKPDPTITKLVKGSKFKPDSLELVEDDQDTTTALNEQLNSSGIS